MTTDLWTGKIYIGQHRVQSLKTYDPWYLGGSKLIQKLVKESGTARFCRDILSECENQDDADILEKFFINIYGSMDPEIGYNRVDGGRKTHGNALAWIKHNDCERYAILVEKYQENAQTNGYKTRFQKGHKLSAESIAKMKAHLPKKRGPLSEATKKKIGDANRGRTSWAKGKKFGPLPQEVRDKISMAHKNKKLSEEHKRKISESLREKRK